MWFGLRELYTVDGISSIFAHMGCEENRQLVTEDILQVIPVRPARIDADLLLNITLMYSP